MNTTTEKIVILGGDHNGVELKGKIKALLREMGFQPIDIGPYSAEEKVDYVDFAKTLGQIVEDEEAQWGVLICGTGVGVSIVANRFPKVRASLVHSMAVAQKTREHNDANVLCLGAWVNSAEENLEIVRTWLLEKFGEGRHVKRLEKIAPHDKTKIVFTNGVFDILHKGHVDLLKFAKSMGGKLIVGINSDRATKILKGEGRPINTENDRKKALESLESVDEVVIFDDTKTIDIIGQIQPDIVVKGGEWTAEEVRQRDQIPDHIEVKIFPLVFDPNATGEKYSTTNIIQKIRKQN